MNKKSLILIILGIVIATALFVYTRPKAPAPVTITEATITEENFSGAKPIITGDSAVAVAARAYIDQSVAGFKARADAEVPDLRTQFPDAAAPSTYTIDIQAQYSQGAETESIVVESYVYTGGANGNSSYTVFTASKKSGALLALSDIVPSEQEDAFTAFIQQQLLDWRPGGIDSMVVFEEEVQKLTFASFKNFSLNDNALTLYFDKYEVGPGVLGAVEFSLPREAVAQYIKEL